MNGHRTNDLVGDFDAYGMPSMPQQNQRSSGLMGRLRKAQSKSQVADAGFGDDDDEGVDPGQGFPGLSIREMSSLGDRHRYPTMDSSSRTMSMASNATYDTTPIIPMLGPQSGYATKKNGNVQYRQRMIDQRKQLLSSDTGLPMPGAPGTQQTKSGRTMSGLSHDPFQGFSNRTMSMSSQRGSRTLSMNKMGGMNNMSSPQVGAMPPNGFANHHGGPPNGYGGHSPHNQLAHTPSPRRSEVDAAHEEIMRLRAELEKRKSAEVPKQQPQRDSRRESEIRSLQLNHHELQLKYNELLEQDQAKSELEDQYNQLENQYSQLHDQHQQLRDTHSALNDQHAALYDQHAALEEEHNALNDQHAALSSKLQGDDGHEQALLQLQNEHASLANTYTNLQQQHNDLQDKYEQLLYQHADTQHLDTAHRELQTKYNALEKSLQQPSEHELKLKDLEAAHQELQDRHAQLENEHQDAIVQNRSLESKPTAPAESETINELRTANEQLTQELQILSIELAESARRELQLPSNAKVDTAAGHLSRLEAELAYERTRRLQAEKHLHIPADMPDLARSHAEATQLLDMRNQEYDMLQARLADALDAADVTRDVVPNPSNTDLDLQYRQLYQHTNFVEQENARLQRMLDEVSDRGPLADRLKSVEDQRDVLQEALRTLRERKDHEIRLLLDRSRQLEARLERPRIASGTTSSSRVYSNSRSSVSSENESQELNGDLTYSTETDKPLEPPRMRVAPRPASPLHINFNMDMYPEQRTRTEQRTSPLPLALGN